MHTILGFKNHFQLFKNNSNKNGQWGMAKE